MDLPEELPEKCENNLHQQFQMLPLVLETLHYIENGDSARADQMVVHLKSQLESCRKTVDEVLCDDTTLSQQQQNLEQVNHKLDTQKQQIETYAQMLEKLATPPPK